MEGKIEALQNRDTYLTELADSQHNAIIELQNTVAKQQETINHHETIIQRQEETVLHHNKQLSDIQQRGLHHTRILATLRRTVKNQNRQIKQLLSQDRPQESKPKALTTINQNRIKSKPMKAAAQSIVQQLDNTEHGRRPAVPQKRLVLNYEGPIAFTATLTSNMDNLGSNQNIVFDHVILNLGNGYHNLHGVFNVPQNGIYVFSASLMFDNKGANYADAYINHNGKDIAGLYSHGGSGTWDHSSQSVVIQANQGDEVWVRNSALINTSVYGFYYSSFSGYLLNSM